MAGRPIFAFLSLILLAAGILFDLFIILSGYLRATPFGKTWFISVATQNLPGSSQLLQNYPRVAWTYFSLAGIQGTGGSIMNHTPVKAAFPFQPRTNLGITGQDLQSLPTDFRTGNFYYLMSRFAWAFFLIALFFAVCALITGLLALCSRIGGYLSGLLASIAAFFQLVAAALMTAWTVKARQVFNRPPLNANAQLGRYAYGWTWAAVACYFLCMILFCLSGGTGKKKETTYDEKKGFFGRRNKSQRNKDGIRDDYS